MTTIAKALNAAMADALAADPKVLVMGEDVGTLGGVFRITDGLKERFGGLRVIDTPLAESGIVGTAIGMAMRIVPLPFEMMDGTLHTSFAFAPDEEFGA